MSDEPAWDRVEPLPITVYTPTFNSPPTEQTEIRIAYDDTHLYVSGRLYDSDRGGVRTNTLYRDQYSGDDVFGIVLDSYNDHETAVWFSINPAGVRSDRSVSNDAEFAGGRPMNADWNSFWDAVTVQTERGWFAEIRIPFSSLGFQDVGGSVEMGLIAYRFIARKNERHLYPAIPPNWDLGFAKPSQAQRILLEGVSRSNPLYLTPYGLAGFDRVAALDSSQQAHHSNDELTYEAGIDVRYNPSSNLNFDLTLNTDFAQVEADSLQVNLTRFSLFLPEKRQFFQERSAIFEFNTGGVSRLFHSRRIGLNEDQPIRIFGGARLVGRVGGTDIGVLDMQTAAVDGLPSENLAVARLRRQVFNPYSTVGSMLTTRIGADGHYDVALGMDGVVRLFGEEYLTLKWAQTFENGGAALGDLDAARLLARWERRNQNGFSYSIDYIRSGAAYDPGLGFTVRSDFTYLQNGLEFRWLLGQDSPFRSVALRARGFGYLRNYDRTVESGLMEPALETELKTGARITLSLVNSYESVNDPFLISDGPSVQPGTYWFHEAQLQFRAPLGSKVRPNLTATAGSFFDGRRTSVQVGHTWSLSRHLELSSEYLLNLVSFRDRNESLEAHLVRARVQIALDTHVSLNSFGQYNSSTNEAGINARLRYNFREGNDLWLVYNETLDTDRSRAPGELQQPLSQGRAITIKYTHTLIW